MIMRDYEPYYTEDGSIGLYSYADKDVFHSKFGALTEAWEKFIIPSNLDNIYKNEIRVLDICYGIGYNTKALMSFFIENNKIKKEKKIKKFFKKVINIVSICVNKLCKKTIMLSDSNDTIYGNKKLSLDCLEINEELVNLSPFFKTIKTPQEYYSKYVPEIFNCFDFYYKLRNLFVKIASKFYPKNKREINELLDLKFKNMHIDKEYKIHPFVNFYLINVLSELYGNNFPNENIKEILLKGKYRRFFEKALIKYALFNQKLGYNKSSNVNLSAFLHNIYYDYLSRRYKKDDFKAIEKLISLRFYINDARKSILMLNGLYDCIYLDAFTYTKAPQLWSFEFIAELYKRLAPSGVLLTYSNSAQIRNTLLENKFYVGKIYNEKLNKFIGTIASKDKSKIKYPLNNYEIGLCNTKAGIPYHDPNLSFSKKEILELREYEFRHSNLMSSSKYIKIRSKYNE